MSRAPDARPGELDAVLDRCLDDLVAGRATVEQCLARWPALAAELRPALEAATAMRAVPRGPERPPDPAQRAAFLAALSETPQQRPHRLPRPRLPRVALPGLTLPSLPTGALTRAAAVAAPAAVIALVAFALTLAGGGSPAAASTLTVFGGEVEQLADGEWVPVADGAALEPGAQLRTGAEGRALLTFVDGSTAAFDPGTELTIETVELNGARRIALAQQSGRLWNDVAPDGRAGASYTVRTPDALVSAQGTVFETTVGEETQVSAAEGTVEVTTDSERRVLAAGEQASVRRQRLLAAAQASDAPPLVEVRVDVPFIAALVAPSGRATGANPDGQLYNQIPGALTSSPASGPQRLVAGALEPGVYQLLLRRVAPGPGSLVIAFEGVERRIPTARLGAVGETLLLRIEVGAGPGGAPTARPIDLRPVPAGADAVVERLVVTDRAQERAEQLAEAVRARVAAQLADRVPTDRPPAPLPPSAPPTRPPAATPAPTPGDRPPSNVRPDATPRPAPTADAPGDAPAPDGGELRERLLERLRAALRDAPADVPPAQAFEEVWARLGEQLAPEIGAARLSALRQSLIEELRDELRELPRDRIAPRLAPTATATAPRIATATPKPLDGAHDGAGDPSNDGDAGGAPSSYATPEPDATAEPTATPTGDAGNLDGAPRTPR